MKFDQLLDLYWRSARPSKEPSERSSGAVQLKTLTSLFDIAVEKIANSAMGHDFPNMGFMVG